ncbi:MAG TPA: methyltransferase domain-containing protein [Thermoanaerobaculia bacterium]
MSDRDIVSEVVAYYEAKLAAFGATARGVDWRDKASQTKRFEQLLRALGLSRAIPRCCILDFGCGYGALLQFLVERGFDGSYIGYDRSPHMVAEARRMYGGIAGATFTSDWDFVVPADYVVASGVFNVRLGVSDDGWLEYVMNTLAALNEKSISGWSANFLTGYADEDRKRPDLYYTDPAAIFDWCKRNASRWVCLLHDYDLYEFTIGVLRRPR